MIYIFSAKNAATLKRDLKLDNKNSWIQVFSDKLSEHEFNPDDCIYLDITGLSQTELKQAIGALKKNGTFWGIIDPKGATEDPASFFFQGASDYIGQTLIKKGIDKKRFSAALSSVTGKAAAKEAVSETEGTGKKKTNTLSASEFESWKKVQIGTTGSYFFLFVSATGKSNIRSLIGETAFKSFKSRLRDILRQNLKKANALLWMEAEGSNLFLIPPVSDNCKVAIEAVLKMILNNRLIVSEKLGLTIPVDFIFALHFGQTVFQAPGKTGEVISESVNYIFHLGMKKAETGRLTISDYIPENVIPKGFQDFFLSAGVFEEIPIRHSKRFVHS